MTGSVPNLPLKGLRQLLERTASMKVLVVGDLMLDRYLWGKVERISPEAPVPIVDVAREENRPGGAANVALNIRALGASVILGGIVGNDPEGKELLLQSRKLGFDTSACVISKSRRTTLKVRVIGNGQQVLRIDKEDVNSLDKEERSAVIGKLLPKVREADLLIMEDYDKGFLDPSLIRLLISEANKAGIMVAVDPKFRNFFAFEGCTLFKPNLKELNEALGTRFSPSALKEDPIAIKQLHAKMPHEISLITLGAGGMLIADRERKIHTLPAHIRLIADVSGAGDTVVAVMALGLLAGLPEAEAAEIANLAGGLVCEEVGVVPVDPELLLREAGKLPA
jgi:rfaE bifunctional protein kinase chain/domain